MWWRQLSGTSQPMLPAPIVLLIISFLAVALSVGLCSLMQPTRRGWLAAAFLQH